jgi:hypothetical protein
MTNEPKNEPGNLGPKCDMYFGMNKIKDPDGTGEPDKLLKTNELTPR